MIFVVVLAFVPEISPMLTGCTHRNNCHEESCAGLKYPFVFELLSFISRLESRDYRFAVRNVSLILLLLSPSFSLSVSMSVTRCQWDFSSSWTDWWEIADLFLSWFLSVFSVWRRWSSHAW